MQWFIKELIFAKRKERIFMTIKQMWKELLNKKYDSDDLI